MGLVLTLLTIAIGIVMVFFVLKSMKAKKMDEFQAVAWLLGSLGIIVFGIFPQILGWLADLLGVWWPPAVLIFFLLVLAFFMLFRHAQAISVQTARLTELSMQVTLLQHENELLKKQLEKSEELSAGRGE